VIRVEDVSLVSPAGPARPGLPSLVLRDNLDWVERETVRTALAQARGIKKDAAEILGLSQRALSYYLAKHRIVESTE
jgi:transcriptional regulator with GAF, ATPase, and Fis domain